jgi:glycosyltransferase involved in cell wall biosynthesis
MPRFSIIVVHYHPTISHEIFCRGIACLTSQTYKDYEILAYHDGPLTDTTVSMPVPIRCTPQRFNDSGHSLRDRGIREATGDYILIFNADNTLYPNALEEVSKAIDRPPRILSPVNGQPLDTNAMIVFAIYTTGFQRFGDKMYRFPQNPEYRLLLSGNPPRYLYIDAMQGVIRRSVWLAEGGWRDKQPDSDGLQYQAIAAKYGYRSIDEVLGIHN